MTQEELKYPIGRFEQAQVLTEDTLSKCIDDIASFPARLKNEVENLNEQQLDTAYRPDGWTIRQVIHHCADSHLNSFIRLKLALTEDNPTIKPYYEERWAELADSKHCSIVPSLKMIEGLHERWLILLNNLSENDKARTFVHPEKGKSIRIDENIALYAWHCNHHLAHIKLAKKMIENENK